MYVWLATGPGDLKLIWILAPVAVWFPGRYIYRDHGHTALECFSNADWAGSKSDKRLTTGYCVFVGGNLVSWKSKKQNVVSSAESEYRAMAQSTYEILWINHLSKEVGIDVESPAKLWCDNQAALHIASNPVYHERTNHIEVDCHFICEKIQENLISTGYVKTGEQLRLSNIQGLSIASHPESPIVFLKLEKSIGSVKDDLKLLENIADLALKEDSVFVVVSKRSTLDKCRLPIGIKLLVSVAHSESDMFKACESLKRVAEVVLNNYN